MFRLLAGSPGRGVELGRGYRLARIMAALRRLVHAPRQHGHSTGCGRWREDLLRRVEGYRSGTHLSSGTQKFHVQTNWCTVRASRAAAQVACMATEG